MRNAQFEVWGEVWSLEDYPKWAEKGKQILRHMGTTLKGRQSLSLIKATLERVRVDARNKSSMAQ